MFSDTCSEEERWRRRELVARELLSSGCGCGALGVTQRARTHNSSRIRGLAAEPDLMGYKSEASRFMRW
jgi:hypothetical protein